LVIGCDRPGNVMPRFKAGFAEHNPNEPVEEAIR
jgi:hypothetical protein